MRLKILEAPVRQNIELFLEIMRRAKQKWPSTATPPEKIFKAWLHRETGQLLFADVAKELLFTGKKDWKPVEISYSYDFQKGEIIFLIEERAITLKGFRCDDMTPLSLQIMRKTMGILNNISQQLKGPSDLATKISVLTKISIDGSVSHFDRNILIDVWHCVDRMGAEAILVDKPVGSYLFRKDPFTDILEEQLQSQHQKLIKCFTLTYSESKKKFCDVTLVYFEGAWQRYDDDPSLEKKIYAELKELLVEWKSVLKYPLYTANRS